MYVPVTGVVRDRVASLGNGSFHRVASRPARMRARPCSTECTSSTVSSRRATTRTENRRMRSPGDDGRSGIRPNGTVRSTSETTLTLLTTATSTHKDSCITGTSRPRHLAASGRVAENRLVEPKRSERWGAWANNPASHPTPNRVYVWRSQQARHRPNTSRTPLRGLGLFALLRGPRLWLVCRA